MKANRIPGLVVTIVGLILLFWIVPRHTEAVDYGWLRPATLPIIAAVFVILASVIDLIFPTGKSQFDGRLALRAGLFFVLSLIGLYLLHRFGFLIAAPLLVMVLMLVIGERRPLWLISGIVLVPLAMWSSIELLLKRPLP